MESKVVECKKGECILCRSSANDDFRLGPKYGLEDLVVHYYCLLFACGLEQNGEDEEGIYGFLKQDIMKEYKRASRLKCVFCKKSGAASACCIPTCRVMFHYSCGVENNILCQFKDSFNMFCVKHRPLQVLPRRLLQARCNVDCPICYQKVEPLKDPNGLQFLMTPCCRSLMHRDCLQRHACSAGMYFFKCPLCNNKDDFVQEMLQFGIYLPEKDASWELEDQAYGDLYVSYSRCDALNCLCPNGRDYDKACTPWDVVVCRLCASHGTHVECGSISDRMLRSWICSVCSPVEKRVAEKKTKKRKHFPDSNDTDSDASSSRENLGSTNKQPRRSETPVRRVSFLLRRYDSVSSTSSLNNASSEDSSGSSASPIKVSLILPLSPKRQLSTNSPRNEKRQLSLNSPRTEKRQISTDSPRTEKRQLSTDSPRSERRQLLKNSPRIEKRHQA
ncbi:E3 ubiquitin-protein ligase PHF7-like [Brevipalpus obovatus]|uniref:E3 ubiquitin-protein ligase PHF7-like n=1 Tax=Brevipalpus obovatus TaxID=246614 RepID=UPI003D9F5E54